MTRIILIIVGLLLVILAIRLVRLIMNFGSSSRPNISDLNDRASRLKEKLKDIQEAEFRDLPPEDESESSDKTDG